MIKKSDKKGQGLSVNAIILIVLGVLVLVVMIIGFTVGWEKIAPWLSSENVESVVQGCETACTTNSVFSYCTKTRVLNDGTDEIEDTCQNFADPANADKYSKYGIPRCQGLCPEETSE